MKIKRTRKIEPVVHVITILKGESVLTADGVLHQGGGSVYDAARHLISEGASPGDRVEVWRGTMKCLSGTIQAFASLAWSGPSKDPQTIRWRPHPMAVLPPLLAEWREKHLT